MLAVEDSTCIAFLQWCLPRLNYRWRGFRKVRRQVCRRIQRRLQALELADIAAYQGYLQAHPEEWRYLDSCCDISVTHFYRDRQIFDSIARVLLPALVSEAGRAGRHRLRGWSLGCCSGEEPYTLSLIWRLGIGPRLAHPCAFQVVATDRNPGYLQRARVGLYAGSSLKDLPPDYISRGFAAEEAGFRLRDRYRAGVEFLQQDIRTDCPHGLFDLICCRNLVFTYFQPELQQRVLRRICRHLRQGGFLVLGAHEALPPGEWPLRRYRGLSAVYQKVSRPR